MTRDDQIGRHATTVAQDGGYTVVTYHSTLVVKFNHNEIVLNSGGWRTSTTKRRMNQTSNQMGLGYRVFQKDWDWYVEYKGETIPFYDGMILIRDGETWTMQ